MDQNHLQHLTIRVCVRNQKDVLKNRANFVTKKCVCCVQCTGTRLLVNWLNKYARMCRWRSHTRHSHTSTIVCTQRRATIYTFSLCMFPLAAAVFSFVVVASIYSNRMITMYDVYIYSFSSLQSRAGKFPWNAHFRTNWQQQQKWKRKMETKQKKNIWEVKMQSNANEEPEAK